MDRRANTTETHPTGPEMLQGQWPDLRGKIRTWWDRLTEADLEQVAGQKSRLIRLVQEKYGYARERAEQEVERRLREYRDATEASTTAEGLGATVAAAAGEVGTKVQDMTARAGEVGANVQDMATAAATSAADTLSGTGAYLQDLPGDLMGLIRRYPVPSVLVGLGVGFLLGRSLGQGWMAWQREADYATRQREAGYPDASIQCSRCGQMVRQSDMVSHSATCTGTGLPSHGGSPT
jgi:uncharacterized protein YjbJ (UPF0337 family)